MKKMLRKKKKIERFGLWVKKMKDEEEEECEEEEDERRRGRRTQNKSKRERGGIRERERFILCFWVNSLKILIYFIFLCFDPIIKRKGP